MSCTSRLTRHNTDYLCAEKDPKHPPPHVDNEGNRWMGEGVTMEFYPAGSHRTFLSGDAIKEPQPLPVNEGQHPECPICHQRLGMHAHSEAQIDAANEKEAVDHPSHYGGDVVHEHIKCITDWGLGYRLGQATKYLCRMGKKGLSKKEMIEDMEKAIWYIQSKIDLVKEDRDQIQS